MVRYDITIRFDFDNMTAEDYFNHLVHVWGDDAEKLAIKLADEISTVCKTRKDNKGLFDFCVNLRSAAYGLGPYNVDEFMA